MSESVGWILLLRCSVLSVASVLLMLSLYLISGHPRPRSTLTTLVMMSFAGLPSSAHRKCPNHPGIISLAFSIMTHTFSSSSSFLILSLKDTPIIRLIIRISVVSNILSFLQIKAHCSKLYNNAGLMTLTYIFTLSFLGIPLSLLTPHPQWASVPGITAFAIQGEFVVHSCYFTFEIFLQPFNNMSEVMWFVTEGVNQFVFSLLNCCCYYYYHY